MAVYGQIDYDGRVQRAAEALSDRYDVVVVSIDSGKGYRNHRFRSRAVWLPEVRRGKGLRHLLFWLQFLATVLRERPWLVYAHDYFLTAAGWAAARLAGAALHYDAHELIIPGPGEPLQSRRERFFCALERWMAPRADSISAANPERAALMREHYGLRHLPLVIRNLPADHRASLDPEAVLARYPSLQVRNTGEVRLVFQGDLCLERGLGEFLTALPHLDARFTLLLVGDGPDKDAILGMVEAEGLQSRVVFLGRVPREHVLPILRTCDIGIVTYSLRGLNNIYCAPNKLYEYVQAGLPVVVTSQPTLAGPVEAGGIGGVVPPIEAAGERPRNVAATIRAVAENLEVHRGRLGAFLDGHRWELEEQRLRAAMDALHADRAGIQAAIRK